MDATKHKLARGFGLNPGVAQRLITAGFKDPSKVKAATDEELLELPGFDQETVDDVREKIG